MPKRSLTLVARRLSAAVCSFALTVQPIAAETGYYYRNVQPKLDGKPASQPGPTQNQVEGTGTLPVYAASSARARPGVPFNFAPLVQSATGPVSWASVGTALPAGFAVSSATGAITGSPGDGAVGIYDGVLLRATDSTGSSGTTQPITVSVVPKPTVTLPSSSSAVAGSQVSIVPSAQNVVGSQSWSLQGVLPAGLSLDASNGRIYGSSIQAGTVSNLVLTVTDSDGATGSSVAFSIQVTSTLQIGGLSTNYGARLAKAIPGIQPSLSGASGQVTWSLASGTLPAGLTLGIGTGAITGTATQAGSYAGIALQARDGGGATVSSAPFSITVANAPTVSLSPLTYFARFGNQVAVNPTATGLVGTPRFVLDGGSLPAGLALDASTGSITGTPNASTKQSNLTLRVVDLYDGTGASSPVFALSTIGALSVASPPDVTGGVGDALTVAAPTGRNVGGTASWSIVGTLPAGLSINSATGVVSGTPTQATASAANVQYRVTDSLDGASEVGGNVRFTVLPAGSLSIAGLNSGYVAYTGQPFSLTPRALGASPPVTWSVSAMPMWAGFDSGTGAITGTPGAAEPTLTVRFTVQDAANKSVTSSPVTLATTQALTVAYGPGSALQGAAFALVPSVSAAQGTPAYSIRSGTLPDGLALDPATGRISGTTFAVGSYPLTVSATDSAVTVASNAFVVGVSASSYTASIPSNPAGRPGQAFSATAVAGGFPGAVSWRMASGTLPTWATLGAATGAITGSPSGTEYDGPFVLEAYDASGNRARTAPFTIAVTQTPVLTAAATSTSTAVGSAFGLTATATNTQGAVSWSLTSGTLPAGLALGASTGAITGTPTTAGTSPNLVLTATDASNATASTPAFSITVNPATPVTVSLNQPSYSATLGQRFASVTPTVSNAINGYTVSLGSGTLPSWATLDAASGVISGTPMGVAAEGTVAGLQLVATDGQGRVGRSPTFSIQVGRTTFTATGAVGFALHPGVPYSGPAPQSSNAVGSVSWSVSPALPAGLAVSASTGAISGTLPANAVAGSATYALVATDSADGSQAQAGSFQVSVLSTPTVAPPSPASMRYQVSSSIVPTASNVAPPLRWSLAAGTLPSGLALDPGTGAITGAPGAVGTTSGLQISVTDAQNFSGTSPAFSLTVGNTLSFDYPPYTGGRIPPQRVTVPWSSAAPIARSPVGNVTYALASGTIPAGMTLNAANGVISGTPTAASSGSVTLRGTDESNASASTPALDVSIGAAPTVALADQVIRVGAPIQVAPAIANARTNPDTGTFGLALSGGSLPAGLSLGYIGQGTTWVLNGTPTAVASVPGLVLRVTDYDGAYGSSAPFSITVQPGITITGIQASYSGRAGAVLATPVQPGVNNAKGSVTWGISNVPGGLGFDSTTGRLSGTPSAAFSGPLTLTATDGFDGAATSATVNLAIAPAIQVLGPTDLSTHVGVDAATQAPPVTGQKGTSLAWTSIGSALPAYAALNGGTGVVTLHNPTLGSVTGLKLQAQDNSDQATGTSPTFALNVLPLPTVSGAATSYTARLGFPFKSSTPTLNNAIGAVAWNVATGTLPGWARIGPDGSISGTPGQGDLGTTSGLTVAGTDATNTSASSAAFTLGVYAQPAITLSSTNATGRLRVGDSYTLTPTATGVSGTQSWAVAYTTGTALPPGLSMPDTRTGVVTGTVTGAGSATFTLALTDSGDGATSSSSAVSLAATAALATASVPDFKVHAGTYFATPAPNATGVGGTASYALSPSAVPPGMNPFDQTSGILSGVPSGGSGPTLYTRTLTDSADGRTSSATFTVTAVDTLAFATQPTDVTVTTGHAVSMTPAVKNVLGTVAYALQRDGASAPNAIAACTGLGFNTGTGSISGNPTAACSVDKLAIVATDSSQTATSNTFVVAVAAASVTLTPASLTLQEGSTGTAQANSNLDNPTWSVSGGPAGTSITQAGVLTFYGNDTADDQTPTTTVSVTATSGPYSKTQGFALTVQPSIVTVATPQQVRSGGTFKASVSSTMTANATWTPAGTASDVTAVTFDTPNQRTATMSGTAPAVSTVGTRTIKVLYAATGAPSGTAAGAAQGGATLTIQPHLTVAAGPYGATIGTAYTSAAPTLGYNIGTVTYGLYNGATNLSGAALDTLCKGLSFSTTSGTISGTPTQACSATTLTVKAHDDGNNITSLVDDAVSASISISVTAATATVASATITEGDAVSMQASSSLSSPTYTFDTSSASRPAWLAINATTGAITGTTADVSSDTNYSFVVKATSGTYTALSPAATLTVKQATVALTPPASVRAGGSGTATVSTTLASGAGYTFSAYGADGTTAATDVTFSAVTNGIVTVTVAASANTGSANVNRSIVATATSAAAPSTGTTATAASAKVSFSVLPALTIAMGDQNQTPGSTTTLKPTTTGVSGSATYALLQSGSAAPNALSSCGYALNTSTGDLTTSGATVCSVSNLTMSVQDSTGTKVTSTPTFSVVVVAVQNMDIATTRPSTVYYVPKGTAGTCSASTTGCKSIDVATVHVSQSSYWQEYKAGDAIELVYPGKVAVGSMAFDFTDNPAGNGGDVQYWSGTSWVSVSIPANYWQNGGAYNSKTSANYYAGDGTIYAQRWRWVYVNSASGAYFRMFMFKFGNTTRTYAN